MSRFRVFFFFLSLSFFFLFAFCIVYWIKLQNIDGNRVQLNEILVLLAKYETTNNFDLDPSKSRISIFYIIKMYWLITNVSLVFIQNSNIMNWNYFHQYVKDKIIIGPFTIIKFIILNYNYNCG